MSWWNFWQKKPEPIPTPVPAPPVDDTPLVPTFTIEGLMDGHVFIKCAWPTPVSQQHGAAIARELANTMYLASVGDLLSTMFQAVALYGNQTEMDGLANAAIDMAYKAMRQRAGHDQDEKLVVYPEEAFRAI